MDGSVALAKACLRAGITRVAATPHVSLRHENSSGRILERRTALRVRLEAEGVDLVVEQGAEVSADVTAGLNDEELRNLSLGGGEWLLFEPPVGASSFAIHKAVFDVQQRGFRVLLAHPERCPRSAAGSRPGR